MFQDVTTRSLMRFLRAPPSCDDGSRVLVWVPRTVCRGADKAFAECLSVEIRPMFLSRVGGGYGFGGGKCHSHPVPFRVPLTNRTCTTHGCALTLTACLRCRLQDSPAEGSSSPLRSILLGESPYSQPAPRPQGVPIHRLDSRVIYTNYVAFLCMGAVSPLPFIYYPVICLHQQELVYSAI